MVSLQSDELLQLFDSVRAKYGSLLADFEEDESYIRGDFGGEIIPEDWQDSGLTEPVKLMTISDAVDNAADHILTFPTITVPDRPVTEGVEAAREKASERQQFLDMWWDRVFVESGDPLKRGAKSLIKGKVVLKKEIRWDLLPDPPKNSKKARDRYRNEVARIGRSQFIWNLQLIPKETVFEDLANPSSNPEFVFEAFKITVFEARRRFPDKVENLSTRDPMETVDYKEYWSRPSGSDRGEYVQWIEGQRVHEDINPYSWETPKSTRKKPDWAGYVPYCIGDPGWGDVREDNNPFDRYVSLTRYMRPVALAETRQMTAAESALRGSVWPILKTQNMPEVEEGERTLDTGPGSIWDLTEEQNAEFIPARELPASIFQFLIKVQQEADRHSKFGALGGVAQRGVDTATEADQNARNAATKLSGPIQTLRRMIIKINSWILQDVEKVLEVPVTLYGAPEGGPSEITLTPTDIGGFYFTNVQLETSDEAALNLRNARTWSDLKQRLKLSDRTAMKMAGIANPEREIDEWMIEQIETSPQAIQLMLMMVLSAFEQLPEGAVVKQAFMEQMARGEGGGGGPQGQQPAMPEPTSPVDQFRAQQQAEAVQAQPERQTF